MSRTKPTILRFLLKSTGNPFEVMDRFHPRGSTVLNRTVWRDNEPRSCGITSVRLRPYSAGSDALKEFDIEVEYRPTGWISYVGNTKYDGWTAMVLDRKNDGTLLDGHGNALPPGGNPVYLPVEVYHDVDFNEIDFGELVGEFPIDTVRHLTYEDVVRQIQGSGNFSASIRSTFMASRRHRPTVKMVLSSAPSGTQTDGFGTRIVNINSFTPHLQQVILDQLTEVVSGFVEGRYSIKNISNDERVFVELQDLLVDCMGKEEGGDGSRFDCLAERLPAGYLDELATRLMATYQVDVTVVEGTNFGLVFENAAAPKSKVEGVLESLAARTGMMRKRWNIEQASAPEDAAVLRATAEATLTDLESMWSEIHGSEDRLRFPPSLVHELRQTREQLSTMIDSIPIQRQVGGGLQACWKRVERSLSKLQEALAQR